MAPSRKTSRKAGRKGKESRKTSRKASRKGSRKASRKGSRKGSRKNGRKARKGSRKQSGGSMAESLAQGVDFASRHTNQHGGAYTALGGAPLGLNDLGLSAQLRTEARTGVLDGFIAEAATQRDPGQAGGRRKSKKSKKSKSKSKKQRGGALPAWTQGAPVDQQEILLPRSLALRAGTSDFSNPLLKD